MANDGDRFLTKHRVRKFRKDEKEKVEGLVKAALSDEEVREGLRFTREDLAALNRTIHEPGRHAQAVQSGLKLKAMVNGLLEREERRGDGVVVMVNTLTYEPERTSVAGGVVVRRKRDAVEDDEAEQKGEDHL